VTARAGDSPPVDPQAQLLRFAEDLRQSIRREQDAKRQLGAIVDQLQSYTIDLRKAVGAERERTEQLEKAYLDTILRLARASAFRDDETQAHADRLGIYSGTLATTLGLPSRESRMLAAVAPMHDIGKIGIPDAILHKDGALNEEEWVVMRRHPGIGASLLRGSNSELIETARLVALTHHEAWDGSGYPQGLRADQIPIVGRIVRVADVYDALRSPRPYKGSIAHEESCRILRQGDGRTRPSDFDPQVLEAFQDVHRRFAEIYEQHQDE
jgi:putative two-component system response regulator